MPCRVFLILIAVFLLQPAAASAQALPDSSRQYQQATRLPELGQHRFIPSILAPNPFITTFVRTATGAGAAFGLDVPLLDIDGNELSRAKGDMAFLVLDFEYQHAFNPWLAARVHFNALGRFGINEQTVLSQGITGIGGFELGAKARLWRNERFQLSAVVDFARSTLYGFTPFDFVQKVIDKGGLGEPGTNELLRQQQTSRFSGGLRLAYSPRAWIGFTVLTAGGAASPFEEDDSDQGTFNAGGSVSFDLRPLTKVPLGFLLSYIADSFSSGSNDVGNRTQTFGFGISYTGRREFDIGIDTIGQRLAQKASNTAVVIAVFRLKMRYYF